MGLITKTVNVKWNSRNKKHYVDLGYEYTKMGDEFEVKVEHLTKGSKIRVKCVCDGCGCELNWRYYDYAKIIKENRKTYCNKCSISLYRGKSYTQTKLKNLKSFEQWCIEQGRQDIVDRWDYELNNCKPSEICYSTNKKYWFKCDKHIKHKSELKSISRFTNGQNGSIECKQCNSFAQWMLDNNLKIEDYWDYDKNTISSWEISYGSKNKIWIKCQEKDYHGSYEIKCCNFIQGQRCTYCSGKKIHPKDSLGQYIIDNYGEDFLWKVWSDKNEKSPFEYLPCSHFKVWWKCLDNEHTDFQRKIKDSNYLEFRCPQCSQERKESILEEKTRLYLEELGYDVLTEYNCTIKPINPKTKMFLPLDNEIILDNGKHLIIEIHGQQHYDISFWLSKGLKKEEAIKKLHHRKLLDRYKKISCIQLNHEYLEISYNSFKDNTYKKIIKNKIKELINKEA